MLLIPVLVYCEQGTGVHQMPKSCLRWRPGHRKVNDLFPISKLGLQPVLPVPSCEDRKETAQSFHLANTTDLVSWQRLVQVPTPHCRALGLQTQALTLYEQPSLSRWRTHHSSSRFCVYYATQPFAPQNECQGREEASCDWHHSHCLPPWTGTQTNLLFPGLPALPVLQLSIQIPGNCKIEDWPISGCPGCFQPSAAFFKCDVVLWLPLKHGNFAPCLCATLFAWPVKEDSGIWIKDMQ